MLAMLLIAAASKAPAQSGYAVIPVTNGGKIAGIVKWSGPEPSGLVRSCEQRSGNLRS